MEDNKMNKNNYKELIQEYCLATQQINKKQEVFLLQQLGELFVENLITDFSFNGLNKYIYISDNFETPNYEVVINVNGYISITDDDGTAWYQVATRSEIKLPYIRGVVDFDWEELEVETIIDGFTSEIDLHRFIELLKVELVNLKQRLWSLNNSNLKLELIEDEKLIQELTSLREVS